MRENPKLKVGDLVPDITLLNDRGERVSLREIEGGAVIYFYPKDMTPGCTTQACELEERRERFEAEGYKIFGVSPDGAQSHIKFREAKSLNFELLVDEDHSAAEAFGVWREKSNYGKAYMGIVRSTFVIRPDHTIAAIYDNVRASGHAARLFADITALAARS